MRLTSATSVGFTQCTFESEIAPPNRLFRGGAVAKGIVSIASGVNLPCTIRSVFFEKPVPTRPHI